MRHSSAMENTSSANANPCIKEFILNMELNKGKLTVKKLSRRLNVKEPRFLTVSYHA